MYLPALTPSSPNPVDVIWDLPSNNRPSPPHSIATIHPLECAGVSHSEKIRHLQQTMSEKKIDVMIISALDEVGEGDRVPTHHLTCMSLDCLAFQFARFGYFLQPRAHLLCDLGGVSRLQ